MTLRVPESVVQRVHRRMRQAWLILSARDHFWDEALKPDRVSMPAKYRRPVEKRIICAFKIQLEAAGIPLPSFVQSFTKGSGKGAVLAPLTH